MDHPDPIRILAFVNDLVRLSVAHGLRLRQYDDHTLIEPIPDGWRGHNAPMGDEECCLTIEVLGPPTSIAELECLDVARTRPASVQSIDPSQFSGHERMALRAPRDRRSTHGPDGLLDPAMPTQSLRLAMGELTSQEVRVARAAIEWANGEARNEDGDA